MIVASIHDFDGEVVYTTKAGSLLSVEHELLDTFPTFELRVMGDEALLLSTDPDDDSVYGVAYDYIATD